MDDQTIVLIETYGNLRILHFKKHPYVKIVIFPWKNNNGLGWQMIHLVRWFIYEKNVFDGDARLLRVKNQTCYDIFRCFNMV